MNKWGLSPFPPLSSDSVYSHVSDFWKLILFRAGEIGGKCQPCLWGHRRNVCNAFPPRSVSFQIKISVSEKNIPKFPQVSTSQSNTGALSHPIQYSLIGTHSGLNCPPPAFLHYPSVYFSIRKHARHATHKLDSYIFSIQRLDILYL